MSNNRLSIIYMFLASLLFAVMNIAVKYLEDIPVAQIVFMRSFVMMIMVLAVIGKKKIKPFGSSYRLLILRGLFGTTGIALFFYTLHKMPLASAVVVHYLTPIITVLFSVLITRKGIKPIQWMFFAICFSGIIIIKGFDVRIGGIPLLMGVLGTIGAAAAYNIISLLKEKEHYLVIMFYFPLVTIPLVLIYIGITGAWIWTTPFNWAILSLIGFLTYLAQYFLTRSYQIGEVNKVSVISYLGIIYALGFGYFMFDEWYSPVVIFGILLVVLGVIGNIIYKAKPRPTQ